MWSKNAIKSVWRVNSRFFGTSSSVLTSQVQKTATRDVEYTDTPKPPRQKVKRFKNAFPLGFFVGKCDPEVLEYPEVLNLEEIEKIQALKGQIQAVADELDFNAVDGSAKVLATLSQFRLNGAKFGIPLGGLDLTDTELLTINEALSVDGSISKLITDQQLVSGVLLNQYGSEDHKEKYLRPLIYGEKYVGGAYFDHMAIINMGDAGEAIALSDGKDGFVINGPKKWVYNAVNADAFIIFALTHKKDDTGQRVQTFRAFIVPADTPGVIISEPDPKYSIRGVPVSKISLNNVKVDANSALLLPDDSQKLLGMCMMGKLNISPVVIGTGKKILRDVTDYAINNNHLATPMIEMDSVKTRLSRIAAVLYSMESAAFLQAGHADLYENADPLTEMCVVKVLASEGLKSILDDALQILGPASQNTPEFQYFGRLLQDSAFYTSCDEPNVNIKMVLALKGLQHAGMIVHDEIRKTRNPFMFPQFIFKRMLEGKKRYGGDKGLDLGLAGYLHPSLQKQSQILEYCISRVFMSAETALHFYGQEVFEKHDELEAIGDLTIATYALAAVLGRASRSYCIGLSESEWEMELAFTLASETEKKVDSLMPRILENRPHNTAHKLSNISQRVIANRGCFTEPPIARNF